MDVSIVLKEALSELEKAISEDSVQAIRVKYLGKKGLITDLLKSLKDLSVEEKKAFGASVNLAKEKLLKKINTQSLEINKKSINEKLSKESIDITFPPPISQVGKLHPISKTYKEVIEIFGNMGFSVA